MTYLLEIAIILALVILNGMLAMSEFAIISAQMTRLQERADAGSSGARVALELAAAPNRFLATVQFGITLVGILAGAVGGATLAGRFATAFEDLPLVGDYSEVVAFALVVGATTYLSLVFGELVPKRLALTYPDAIASIVARPLNTLGRLGRPIVALLSLSTRGVLRLLGVSETPEAQVTEEEIRVLLAQGARSGAIDEAEQMMALGILDLGDLTAGALMTPRRRIVWIDADEDEEISRQRMVSSSHSYYPVFVGEVDNVLGFVAVKDLWRLGEFDLQRVLTPAQYVPDTAPAINVLELFKRTGVRRALVVDEYGSIEGLITMHDIMEAIVGELDAAVAQDQPIVQRPDGSWLIDGMVPLHELRDELGIDLISDEAPGGYQTLGGFVMAMLGRVPAPADRFEHDGLSFEVVDMDRARVDKVLVTRIEPSGAD